MASLWARRGIWVEAFASHPQDAETISAPASWQPRQWAARCRLWISDTLARGIENKGREHSLITSMVLGVRAAGIGEAGCQFREAECYFRETGTLHLFSVSGLNLTMLAWLLTTGFRLGGAGPRLTTLLALPILVVYALAVGLSPSCLRALLGTVLLLGCVWVERPSVAYNNIGAAALVLFFADTNALFQGGFQLSFSMVLALLWVATPLGKCIGRLSQPDPLLPRKLWSLHQRWRVRLCVSIATTVAASLVTFVGGLPWSCLVFHLVSPAGMLVNLLVIPLAFAILSLGLLSVFSAPLGPVSPWINNANALLSSVLLEVVRRGSRLPRGHCAVANPFAKRPDFVILDAGNGGAVLLNVPGRQWLLDCGSEAQFGSLLLPGLRSYGLNRLEGLVLTHGDAAHIGGALATLQEFQPRHVLEPAAKDRSKTRKRLAESFASAGKLLLPVAAGDTPQNAPHSKVEILFPPTGLRASLADDKGLVVRFSTQHWSLLYTADAGYPTERWLLEHRPEQLHADVWVRGGHTREVTGTDAFVEAVNPALIVVSGASFGQDSQRTRRWAEYWRAQGKTVCLQQETGAIEGWGGTVRRARAFLTGSELRW
jgi:ComEC/Rec2-related protein